MTEHRQIAVSAAFMLFFWYSAVFLAFAGEEKGGALEPILAGLSLRQGEVLLGMAGYDGDPLPTRWHALVGKVGDPDSLHEVGLKSGAVISTRVIHAGAGEDLPHLPVDRESVKISAEEAHRIAAERANLGGTRWATVHYHLRVRDEEADPVWLLTFVSRAQVRLGHVYLSARTGEILRESWPHRPGAVPDKTTTDRTKVSAR